jgi:hypothetical protein
LDPNPAAVIPTEVKESAVAFWYFHIGGDAGQRGLQQVHALRRKSSDDELWPDKSSAITAKHESSY